MVGTKAELPDNSNYNFISEKTSANLKMPGGNLSAILVNGMS